MAELGLASRREADEWIEKGWVLVDGRKVSTLGSRVTPQQRITVLPQAMQHQAQRVTVLLNKPVGYVSGQAEDGHLPASVLIQPDQHWAQDPSPWAFHPSQRHGLAPAGRLDLDSDGLLVLTQDGRIARQLVGQDHTVEKEYHVWVEPMTQGMDPQALERLGHGLVLDDEPLRPAGVHWHADGELRIVLTEGRKRQVRRMCELVGLKVLRLQRVRIGRVHLGDLPLGQWRYLGPEEAFI